MYITRQNEKQTTKMLTPYKIKVKYDDTKWKLSPTCDEWRKRKVQIC